MCRSRRQRNTGKVGSIKRSPCTATECIQLRPVQWLSHTIERADMSLALKSSAGSIGTVSNGTGYGDEIEKLIGGALVPTLVSTDETVADPTAFALEKHLEVLTLRPCEAPTISESSDLLEWVHFTRPRRTSSAFQQIAEGKSAHEVLDGLARRSWSTKQWVSRSGRQHPGRAFKVSDLARLVQNDVCGEATRRGANL